MEYRNDCYFFDAYCGDDENAQCDWHDLRVGNTHCDERCPYYINENIADAIIRGKIADRIANLTKY